VLLGLVPTDQEEHSLWPGLTSGAKTACQTPKSLGYAIWPSVHGQQWPCADPARLSTFLVRTPQHLPPAPQEIPLRKALALTAATAASALVVVGLASAPAQAQSVTFSLTGSTLAIAEPATAAALTGGALAGLAGSSITGALGATTVTDARGGTTGWTSSITGTTAFGNGTTTIPVTSAVAWVTTGGIATTGVVTATQGTHLLQGTGLALTAAAQALVTATVVLGNNTAIFTPQLAVSIPSNATAGAYSGAVTQTVS
jgi:hypothetical protein